MAIVILLHWPEVSQAQYEQARKEINWEGKAPKGAKLHIAWFGKDGFHVLDLWESREDFERFIEQRLMPGVRKVGIQGQPKVEFAEAHAVFAPSI